MMAMRLSRRAARLTWHAPCMVRPTKAAVALGRPFTQSVSRFGRGSVDKELSAKFAAEWAFEREEKPDLETLPPGIQEFIKHGPFTVTDIQGNDEIMLERTFGNETIRMTFSVSAAEDAEGEDFDFEGEEGDHEAVSGDDNNNNNKLDEGGEKFDFRVPCDITIQKDGSASVLCMQAMASEGAFTVERMMLYDNLQLGLGKTAELDWQRREKYMGPEFAILDGDLQVLMEAWLEERGINTSLALFVPDYIEYKENREYAHWLKGMQTFIEI